MAETLIPDQANGLSIAHLVSAATNNATFVKGGSTKIYSWSLYNTNAAARYVKIYDKASIAAPGTDIPVATLMIPGTTVGAGNNQSVEMGVALLKGFSFAITGGIADLDNTSVSANDVVMNIYYK